MACWTEGWPNTAMSQAISTRLPIWPWTSLWKGQQQQLDDKPNLTRWLDELTARPAVQAGRALHAELRGNQLKTDKSAQDLLFKTK